MFARRNEQARRFGARLVILRREVRDGKVFNVRGFPDEVPFDTPTNMRGVDFGGCGFHCQGELELAA